MREKTAFTSVSWDNYYVIHSTSNRETPGYARGNPRHLGGGAKVIGYKVQRKSHGRKKGFATSDHAS
jgi:hypothetical protein